MAFFGAALVLGAAAWWMRDSSPVKTKPGPKEPFDQFMSGRFAPSIHDNNHPVVITEEEARRKAILDAEGLAYMPRVVRDEHESR